MLEKAFEQRERIFETTAQTALSRLSDGSDEQPEV